MIKTHRFLLILALSFSFSTICMLTTTEKKHLHFTQKAREYVPIVLPVAGFLCAGKISQVLINRIPENDLTCIPKYLLSWVLPWGIRYGSSRLFVHYGMGIKNNEDWQKKRTEWRDHLADKTIELINTFRGDIQQYIARVLAGVNQGGPLLPEGQQQQIGALLLTAFLGQNAMNTQMQQPADQADAVDQLAVATTLAQIRKSQSSDNN